MQITATITFNFDFDTLPREEIIEIIKSGEFFPEDVIECEIIE